MHIKYCLLTIFSYWASLSTFLPSTTAHKLIKAPADEDNFEESLPKRVEALISGENGELSTEQMVQELLAGFDDNFAVVSQKSDSEKKSKKPAKKKGKGKGKGNKKEPGPVVVIEEPEESEDEDDDDEESDDKEDTVVIGRPDNKSDESSSNNGSGSKTVIDDDSDIKQVGARISDDYQHYEVLTCTMVEIPLDQKGIELTFNPISNTQKIMLSTSELTNCRHILESACPANAKFCQVQDLSEGTYLKLGEEVCHHNVAYLYLIPNNPADSLEFELKISVTNEVECKVTEQQGPVVNMDQYCEGLSAEQCQENAADACSSKCMWVTCKVNNQDQQTQSSAYCAQSNTQRDSLQQTCSKSQDFASAAPENQVIEYPVCAAPSVDQSVEQNESGSHINILSILGITFGVSLALCLVFSCYYRYQFRHNKRELCSPPEWCPNFLFPRNSNQMEGFMSSGNRHKEQEMSGDYQPPVL